MYNNSFKKISGEIIYKILEDTNINLNNQDFDKNKNYLIKDLNYKKYDFITIFEDYIFDLLVSYSNSNKLYDVKYFGKNNDIPVRSINFNVNEKFGDTFNIEVFNQLKK